MGCREPCDVLHRLGRLAQIWRACYWCLEACLLLVQRPVVPIQIFWRRGPVGSECVDREFISDHSRDLSQGTLFKPTRVFSPTMEEVRPSFNAHSEPNSFSPSYPSLL